MYVNQIFTYSWSSKAVREERFGFLIYLYGFWIYHLGYPIRCTFLVQVIYKYPYYFLALDAVELT